MAKEKCEEHSGCLKAIEKLEQSDIDQWDAINKIRNRLPVWATLGFSFLTFLLGCSIKGWLFK